MGWTPGPRVSLIVHSTEFACMKGVRLENVRALALSFELSQLEPVLEDLIVAL